jgi:multidrug efflux pump subunit AcrA (membrane-fusion protein)
MIRFPWLVLFAATLHALSGGILVARAADAVIEPCSIEAQHDVLIAGEAAGVLLRLPLQEGAQVRKEDLLATIDDLEARAALEVAQIGYEAAKERAASDIEIRYAKKASAVALANWKKGIESNKQHKGAMSDMQLRQDQLDYERLELQIEKAEQDMVLAQYDVKMKKAELKAAQMAVDRRQVVSPFDGEIVKRYRQKAEWINPGDPILRLVQFDRLRVEGFVDSALYNPSQFDGRSVTIRVPQARGQEAEVSGKIVYISQSVEHDNAYLIRAEIENERRGNHWLIRPGQKTSMTIKIAESEEPKAESR